MMNPLGKIWMNVAASSLSLPLVAGCVAADPIVRDIQKAQSELVARQPSVWLSEYDRLVAHLGWPRIAAVYVKPLDPPNIDLFRVIAEISDGVVAISAVRILNNHATILRIDIENSAELTVKDGEEDTTQTTEGYQTNISDDEFERLASPLGKGGFFSSPFSNADEKSLWCADEPVYFIEAAIRDRQNLISRTICQMGYDADFNYASDLVDLATKKFPELTGRLNSLRVSAKKRHKTSMAEQ